MRSSDNKNDPVERTTLRIPDELKAKLKASAWHSRRTLNAEIEARLIESYGGAVEPPPPLEQSSLQQRVARLEAQLEAVTPFLELLPGFKRVV